MSLNELCCGLLLTSQVAPACNIFARASPENKLRIVRALQRAAPAAAAAALAKAAGGGRSLAAVSRDLVTKSQELASRSLASTSAGIATTSRMTSPDVLVDVDLSSSSYGSDLGKHKEQMKMRCVYCEAVESFRTTWLLLAQLQLVCERVLLQATRFGHNCSKKLHTLASGNAVPMFCRRPRGCLHGCSILSYTLATSPGCNGWEPSLGSWQVVQTLLCQVAP